MTRSAAHLIAASVLAALAAPAAFAASHSVVADYTLLKAHSSGMPVPDGLGGYIGPAVGGGHGTGGEIVRFVPGRAGQPWAETVIYTFGGGSNGAYPQGRLLADGTGGFVGITLTGGAFNYGTVFRIAPPASQGGSWTQSVLYNFQGGATDTAHPHGNLYAAPGGGFYGVSDGVTTHLGGAVFQLIPPSTVGGAWTDKVLYSFVPPALSGGTVDMAQDPAGDLYVVLAAEKGIHHGQVAQLVPPVGGAGGWTLNLLHTFPLKSTTSDGAFPTGIYVAPSGVVYGVASYGGVHNQGMIYALTNSGGVWSESVAYSFAGGTADGAQPTANPSDDGAGGFLVSAANGGATGNGAVVDFTPGSAGLSETVVYNFLGGADGKTPHSSFMPTGSGSFLAGTAAGGTKGLGTIYELTP